MIAESQQAINVQQAQDGAEPTITANAAPQITSQYGIKPDSTNSTGVLFIKTKNTKEQDTIAYYHHDHLGTPIQATDRSGIIVWSAQYNAFGSVSITTPTATDDKPTIESNLRLPGQLEDAETGLYYNWHRYYDPELGRYVTADPIGLVGGVNLYSYVGGNPVNLTDRLGLHDDGNDGGIPIPPPEMECKPMDKDGQKCDKKLSDEFLKRLGIDPHKIKRDMIPGGGWGAYNLCGCEDGRILLKRSKDCKDPGGEDTGERWK